MVLKIDSILFVPIVFIAIFTMAQDTFAVERIEGEVWGKTAACGSNVKKYPNTNSTCLSPGIASTPEMLEFQFISRKDGSATSVTSNSDGKFFVELPVGEYELRFPAHVISATLNGSDATPETRTTFIATERVTFLRVDVVLIAP